MIFENGGREPLHGHNYRVQIKGEAPDLAGDMVFDFLDIKPIVREVCDFLDHGKTALSIWLKLISPLRRIRIFS